MAHQMYSERARARLSVSACAIKDKAAAVIKYLKQYT